MNARQRRFCDEYLIDQNATQAAIRAGYSEKTAKTIGNENLTKPDLKAYIDSELEKMHSAAIADAEEVMEYLSRVLRGEETEETPIMTKDGSQKLIDKRLSAKDRIKAGELLGKRYGMFTEKVDVNAVSAVEIVDDIDAQSK